jgi:hypothetical protein
MPAFQGYPTGRSPFAVDLAPSIDAITNRMVRSRREAIAREEGEISANERAILEVFDVESVQGMSDQIQETHMKELDTIDDKWSNILREKSGKLSREDLVQLRRDKRGVESKIADMQTDVKAYNFARGELLKPGARDIYDVNESARRMMEIKDKGLIGAGRATQILAPKRLSLEEKMYSDFGKQIDAKAKLFSETIASIDTAKGKVEFLRKNREQLSETFDAMVESRPEYKAQAKKESGGLEGARQRFFAMHGMDTKAEKFYQAYTAPKAGAAGLKPEYVGVVDKYNRALEGILRRDKRYLEELGSAITAKGNVKDVSSSDKYLTITYDNGQRDRISYPATERKQDIDTFKNKVGEILQGSTNYKGKNVPGGLPAYIEPFYKEEGVTFEEGKKTKFSSEDKESIMFDLTKQDAPMNTTVLLDVLKRNDALFDIKPKRIDAKIMRVGDKYYEVAKETIEPVVEQYLTDANAGTITDIKELSPEVQGVIKVLDSESDKSKPIKEAVAKIFPDDEIKRHILGTGITWGKKEYNTATAEGKNELIADIVAAASKEIDMTEVVELGGKEMTIKEAIPVVMKAKKMSRSQAIMFLSKHPK